MIGARTAAQFAVDNGSNGIGPLVGYLTGLAGVLAAVVTAWLSRRSSRDATEAVDRATAVDAQLANLQVLAETVDVLQEERADLRSRLSDVEARATRTERALRVETQNRRLLEEFVRMHVPPEVERPQLRVVEAS